MTIKINQVISLSAGSKQIIILKGHNRFFILKLTNNSQDYARLNQEKTFDFMTKPNKFPGNS